MFANLRIALASSPGRLAVAALLTLAIALGCSQKEEKAQSTARFPESYFPERAAAVDPGRCAACHSQEVEAWRRSQHAVANHSFDPHHDLERFGHPVNDDFLYQPSIEGEPHIAGPGAETAGEAVGVIGVSPLIQYLIAREDGRFQAHELAYDPSAEEWFNIFGDEAREEGEWGHWSGQGMNWNTNCAWCHMTDFDRNYDPATDTYASTWITQGISCLQCHANSAAHADAAERENEYISADLGAATATARMENCASCHSRRGALTNEGFVAGDSFHDHFRLSLPDEPEIYFPDGQNQDENYVFGSFMLSRMGHAGVTCADCHDPHSEELILPVETNALCMRCHGSGLDNAPLIEPVAHSHHTPDSSGNRCVECHMPQRTYMARDPRRDHGFTSPDPELSLELGTPDACLRCHQEDSSEWIVEQANAWYNSPKRETRRARARLLATAHNPAVPFPAEDLEAAVRTTEEAYWVAAYLRLLARSPEPAGYHALARQYATSKDIIVRAAALRLLGSGNRSPDELRPFLEDGSRQVRVEALEALEAAGLPIPEAGNDYADLLAANADRPLGAFALARQSLETGNTAAALGHLRRAASFDRLNPEIYFQGALLLDGYNQTEPALNFLASAPSSARSTGLLAYAESLLLAAQGNIPAAIQRLQEAVAQDPSQDRWWYNLALAYTKLPHWPAAGEAIGHALQLAPTQPAYRDLARIIDQQLR